MFTKSLCATMAAALAVGLTACSGGDGLTTPAASTLYVSTGANLVSLNSQDRLTVNSSVAISGLTAGTTLVGMDANPNGGALVGLGSDGQVYTLDVASGTATKVGSPEATVNFANKAVDIDFNPRVQNVFRVITSSLENLRRNAITGAKPGTGSSCSSSSGRDCSFSYKTGDVNASNTIATVAVAYTDSQKNGGTIPTQTTVYVLDAQNDVLARLGAAPASGTANSIDNPNEGKLTTIGALGINIDGNSGFDFDSRGTASNADDVGFVVTQVAGTNHLFTVNTGTGKLTDAGALPPDAQGAITGFAVAQR